MSNLIPSYPATSVHPWDTAEHWNWQTWLALLVLGAASLFSGNNSGAALLFWATVYVAMVVSDWRLMTFALVSASFLFEATRLENGSISVTEVVIAVVALRIIWAKGPVNLIKESFPPDLQDGLLLGMFGLILLSVIWVLAGHGENAAALKSLGRYVEYAIAYLCLSRLLSEPAELKELEFFLSLVAAVLALVGIYQHFLGPQASAQSFPWGADVTLNADADSFRIYSVFSNPIFLSAFCGFFVPFTLDRVIRRDEPHRFTYAVCFALVSAALLLTSSRTGMLGAAVGLFVLAGKNIKKIAALAIGVVIVIGLFSTKSLEDRLLQTGSSADLTGAIRLLKYYRTALVILEHPIAGVGTGEYQTYFLAEIAPDLPKEGYGELTAENTFLQIGAELGVPGLMLYCVLVITILARAYRLRKADVAGGRGLFAGVCAFTVSSLFVSMTAVSAVLLMLILYLLVKRNHEFFYSQDTAESAA